MRWAIHLVSITLLLSLGACFDSSSPESPPSSPCEAYCQASVECDPGFYEDVQECERDCISEIEEVRSGWGQACGEANAALYACIGALSSCGDYEDYWEEPTPDYPCHEEEDRLFDCD